MMLPMTVRCNVCGTFMYKVSAGLGAAAGHTAGLRGPLQAPPTAACARGGPARSHTATRLSPALPQGTKFNTRMEDVRGENYLGIKIFR